MNRKTAPFTDAEVRALRRWQDSVYVHPFTCRNRDRNTHPWRDDENDFGLLVPTKDGWICRDCDYTQDWAFEMMFEPTPDLFEPFK